MILKWFAIITNIIDKYSYLTPKLVKAPKTIKTSRLHEQKIEYIITE